MPGLELGGVRGREREGRKEGEGEVERGRGSPGRKAGQTQCKGQGRAAAGCAWAPGSGPSEEREQEACAIPWRSVQGESTKEQEPSAPGGGRGALPQEAGWKLKEAWGSG